MNLSRFLTIIFTGLEKSVLEKRIKQKLGYKSPIQYRASIGISFILNGSLNC